MRRFTPNLENKSFDTRDSPQLGIFASKRYIRREKTRKDVVRKWLVENKKHSDGRRRRNETLRRGSPAFLMHLNEIEGGTEEFPSSVRFVARTTELLFPRTPRSKI